MYNNIRTSKMYCTHTCILYNSQDRYPTVFKLFIMFGAVETIKRPPKKKKIIITPTP